MAPTVRKRGSSPTVREGSVKLEGGHHRPPFYLPWPEAPILARRFSIPVCGNPIVLRGNPILVCGEGILVVGNGILLFGDRILVCGEAILSCGKGILLCGEGISLVGKGISVFGNRILLFGEGNLLFGNPILLSKIAICHEKEAPQLGKTCLSRMEIAIFWPKSGSFRANAA